VPFRFTPLEIPEVILIEPTVFPDQRGFFMETYKRSDFAHYGIAQVFVQENQSLSTRFTLRGLHYQKRPKDQGKLVRVVHGEVFDVAVDVRKGSPTRGKWVGTNLSAQNKRMLYIPPGFAHGFCVLSDEASTLYMVTEEYAPECERGILWNDTDLSIRWPINEPILAARDREWPPLREVDTGFVYNDAPEIAKR
jgi:dTDP-4-dehydrorhamnose 3,5-epimerase